MGIRKQIASNQILKCTKKQWCWSLEDRINHYDKRYAKGFSPLILTNMKTGDGRVAGMAYRMDSKDPGLLIHYCPWCQVDLYKLFEIKSKAE